MRLPIRIRLTLGFAGLLAAVLAVSGALVLFGFQAWLVQGEREKAQAMAEEYISDVAKGEPDVLDDFDSVESPKAFAQILNADGSLRETSRGIEAPVLSARDLAHLEDLDQFMIPAPFVAGQDTATSRAIVYASPTPQGPIVIAGWLLAENDHLIGMLGGLLAAVGGALLIVVSGLAWLLSGAALRPVERMRKEAALISETDLDRRLADPATNDEVAELAATLNDMLARIGEAFKRERRFVDDASHELRTPLSILKTELQLALQEGRTHEELHAALISAASESDRLIRLAENLLVMARLNHGETPLQRSNVDLAALAQRVATRFGAHADEHAIRLDLDVAPGATAWADELRLEQALGNLLANALAHTPPGGVVAIQVAHDQAEFVFTVSDTGPGFPPNFLEKAFVPFARARNSKGDGAGLGLAIVQGIACAHGGSVVADNQSRGGARVTLRAPRMAET